ncbi:MAG: 1-acyl-sn-glycerol-3-phosphate acyltransferase [Eubacteriales bacterium]|nr:1-acyl-sn-glycerol-3-phosphate acyltransferase [Eubacteriales bacterium]
MLLKTITGLSILVSCVLLACMGLSVWMLPLLFIGIYAALFVLAVAFLWVICALVDFDKPQEEDSKFYRAVMHVYIEALIQLVRVRLHTKGLENTPKEGRFLLVCNHLFVADPGIVLHCFRKSQLAFLTKKENYKLPFIGAFMHKILCQPIDRENDRQALKSIIKCIQLIKEDKVSVCAFPEGYTSKDGKLHPFRPGVFKIAQKTNVPIVVCTIQNTRQIFKNLKHFGHTDVELHLVEVIQPGSYAGMNTVALSDMVYEKMIADLGEEYRYCE